MLVVSVLLVLVLLVLGRYLLVLQVPNEFVTGNNPDIMTMKKLDNRLRILIENSVKKGHRSFFVVVGEKARDQVVILHQMLSKAQVKARPSVLWCYKKELGFST